MKWFGAPSGARYERDTAHVATPVGALCAHCDESIAEADIGMLIPHLGDDEVTEQPYHYACFMRGLVGGLNHQLHLCGCYGGSEESDPPGLSKRKAAEVATLFFSSPGLLQTLLQ